MKKLRDILQERVRTPEEANKLWNYIGKRAQRKKGLLGRISQFRGAEIPLKNTVKFPHDFWAKPVSDFKASREDVPMDKIRYSQPSVFHATVSKYLKQGDNHREAAFIKRRDGTYDHLDGHHRTVADKLRGKKSVKATVWRYKDE